MRKYVQQLAFSIVIMFSKLLQFYRVFLRSIIIFVLVIVIWQIYIYHIGFISLIENFNSKKKEIYPLLPNLLFKISKPIEQISQKNNSLAKKVNEKKIFEVGIHEYVVSTGDTLSSVLNQHNVNMDDIIHLVKIDKNLHKLKIGQKLSWTIIKDNYLRRLTWEISHRETRIYNRIGNDFKISYLIQQSDWINKVLQGTIVGSFVSSALNAGLTKSEINKIVKTMQCQMDFRKLKKGDEFSVLMSREIFDGKKKRSQLIGVRLRSKGKDYYAIRAEDGKFYDRNGTRLTKGFLNFPTERQFRVSSNFNPNRLNPVTWRITPHRGVDFAMPQGTPVLAVSDGKVIVAKHSGAAGYYVAIRHSMMYTTRYMHLCKLLVRPGQKVKRGDRIALSGNTGRSTGPHLHYEVWINKKVVNPLTAKLPRAEGLTGKNRRDYLTQVMEIVSQLK